MKPTSYITVNFVEEMFQTKLFIQGIKILSNPFVSIRLLTCLTLNANWTSYLLNKYLWDICCTTWSTTNAMNRYDDGNEDYYLLGCDTT
jgi:hypothetical protein